MRVMGLGLLFFSACGGSVAGDAGADGAVDGGDGSAVVGDAGCASSATTEACLQCCRLPNPPSYGAVELYFSQECTSCPTCAGKSPCGTNVTPPAGKDCVACLTPKLGASPGLASCKADQGCAAFLACMQACPLR
jgi:hypothetical protein